MSNLNLVFSAVFVVALVAMVGTKLWLASRQIRHVAANRNDVPQQFTGTIPLAAHQRAADYTVERTRLTMIEVVVSAAVLIALTLLGGVQQLDLAISDFSSAVQISQRYADAFFKRGMAYFQKGNFEAAASDITKCTELWPKDPKVYRQLALIHDAMGQKDQAAIDRRKAREIYMGNQ